MTPFSFAVGRFELSRGRGAGRGSQPAGDPTQQGESAGTAADRGNKRQRAKKDDAEGSDASGGRRKSAKEDREDFSFDFCLCTWGLALFPVRFAS